MPRGSKPGERRGGRQRGTPNNKTLIKNAVFLAAASDGDRSPLNFMLALMRDPQVPLDLRIDMAATAAPFVHAKPEPARNKRPDPLDLRDRLGETGDLKFGKLEAKGAEASGGVSPLDFLLGVMGDPAATPRQRVKTAAIAARYTHARAGAPEPPTVIVLEDKFGFKVDAEVARAERDDMVRESKLRSFIPSSAEGIAAEGELEQIHERREERVARVKFPYDYTSVDREADRKRLNELESKRRSGKKLTSEEDAEEAHLAARVLNPEVKAPFPNVEWLRTLREARESKVDCPESRIAELEERFVVGETPLTAAEEDELNDLRRRYPGIAAEVDRLDHRYRYCVRREEEKAVEAGFHWLDARREARIKCERLRDPTKTVALIDLYELEKRRFVKKLTPTEAALLEDLARLYPERVEKARNTVWRRNYGLLLGARLGHSGC
jgi:hypothetical protein